MSNVISQADIQKTRDNADVVFPVGTLITPSAMDWANDHGIRISFGVQGSSDREDFLKSIVSAVLKEFAQEGKVPMVDMVVEAVNSCLARLGCKVGK